MEREAITADGNGTPGAGRELSADEIDMVLHEEKVVVTKVIAAKERVHLEREVVTTDEAVAEDLRTERVEADGRDRAGRKA